jgi:hypothetical protein
VPITFNVAKADLSLDSVFSQPEFGLFRDTPALLRHLFMGLRSHAPQLRNLRLEGGEGSVGEFHVACHLYDFRAGVRVYTEKVTVACINILENELDTFSRLVVDALSAVKAHQSTVAFRTHTITVVMHGQLEGKSVNDYVSAFAKNFPTALGPPTGNGAVVYFGPKDDRIASSVTLDLSVLLADGMFVRSYVVWDATKVEIPALPARTRAFVGEVLDAFGLQVPTLRS